MRIPRDKLIVCADDFGISPGVNQAIIEAHTKGVLTHASLLANGAYLEDAVKLSSEMAPSLKLGLHINLTGGKPVLPSKKIPGLVNEDGDFKYGSVTLLFKVILKPFLLLEIREEIEAQINKLQKMGVHIFHMDGHHHVQMIPGIFKIVEKFADKYKIPRIRVVNEDLNTTILQTGSISFLKGGGLAKYALLSTLCSLNKYKTRTYFFSIVNSCRIPPELIKNISIPKGFDSMEIMLHPGNPGIDKDFDTGNIDEYEHLTSEFRTLELQTALELKKFIE